ncbi:MAG: hypothetical protein HKP53_07455 [Eudoraea sp.]|nr:hypothetical protein [Eudoraea sp.]
MKVTIYLLLCSFMCCLGCSNSTETNLPDNNHTDTFFQPAQVLFIGNSHTNYNNGVSFHLRGFLNQADLPYTPVVEKMTMDGYTIQQHSENANTLAKMAERDWDIMVFQENTSEAANNPVDATIAIQELRFKVPNSETRLFLFMTWAYESMPGMLTTIKKTYEDTAPLVNGTIVPVGLAFQEIQNDPENLISLYDPDGIHPSLGGTFLASAMFYASIYEKDPRLNPYNADLTEEVAAYLKEKAYEVVQNYSE